MGFLSRLLRRSGDDSAAATATAPEVVVECPHTAIGPRWDDAADMGNEAKATSYQCEACGDSIPWGRIKAVPYATLCVGCKEKQELSGSDDTGAAGWGAVDEFETLGQDM